MTCFIQQAFGLSGGSDDVYVAKHRNFDFSVTVFEEFDFLQAVDNAGVQGIESRALDVRDGSLVFLLWGDRCFSGQ